MLDLPVFTGNHHPSHQCNRPKTLLKSKEYNFKIIIHSRCLQYLTTRFYVASETCSSYQKLFKKSHRCATSMMLQMQRNSFLSKKIVLRFGYKTYKCLECFGEMLNCALCQLQMKWLYLNHLSSSKSNSDRYIRDAHVFCNKAGLLYLICRSNNISIGTNVRLKGIVMPC